VFLLFQIKIIVTATPVEDATKKKQGTATFVEPNQKDDQSGHFVEPVEIGTKHKKNAPLSKGQL
jgi:hypothetical protein